MSAFKDHRFRLTLCRPLKGHCTSYLSQGEYFVFLMGVSLTYSIDSSPESRPRFMKTKHETQVLFAVSLLLTSFASLVLTCCTCLEDNVQQGHPFFSGITLPLGPEISHQNAVFHPHFTKPRLLFTLNNIIA